MEKLGSKSEIKCELCLRDYIKALQDKDLDRIHQLVDETTLLEIPFLRPPRLLGTREILNAHREVFANLEFIKIIVSDWSSNDGTLIAEGDLSFRFVDSTQHNIDMGVVVEADQAITRFSLYADSRNIRRWSDKTIL